MVFFSICGVAFVLETLRSDATLRFLRAAALSIWKKKLTLNGTLIYLQGLKKVS